MYIYCTCRFRDVIEVLPQQVFYLKCTIRSQMLSPDTEYVCYLVFKLSEKCQGLHCLVKVRDILHKENNEAECDNWQIRELFKNPHYFKFNDF